MREIELNKRPAGTRVVDGEEKERTIQELLQSKAELQKGIENMGISLYTVRQKNQMNGYIERLNEVDKALMIFNRKKVFVAA